MYDMYAAGEWLHSALIHGHEQVRAKFKFKCTCPYPRSRCLVQRGIRLPSQTYDPH